MAKGTDTYLKNITAVILCGGLGTRLQSAVPQKQKVLARIGDKTFLDLVIDGLVGVGVTDIILCTGHLKDQVRDHFSKRTDCTISFSEEDAPLGTGGALKKALSLVRSDPFLVMNGDSLCSAPLADFLMFHKENKGVISMALVSDSRSDGGSVKLDNLGSIGDFKERQKDHPENLLNAGMYFLQKDISKFFPAEERFSLEYDLFPNIPAHARYGFPVEGELIDIGTPERYEYARKKLVSLDSYIYFYA